MRTKEKANKLKQYNNNNKKTPKYYEKRNDSNICSHAVCVSVNMRCTCLVECVYVYDVPHDFNRVQRPNGYGKKCNCRPTRIRNLLKCKTPSTIPT